MPATWVPKLLAAIICFVATIVHIRSVRRSPVPALDMAMAGFFFGGASSAAIGVCLELFYSDTQRGVAFDAMLVGVEFAAAGAWSAGFTLLAQALPTCGAQYRITFVQLGAASAAALFVTTLVLVFLATPTKRFDAAFLVASYGGCGLLIGASALAIQSQRHRLSCWLLISGLLVTATGYTLDAAWLGPACAPGAKAPKPCPLPPTLTADGVYHTALMISYSLFLAGSRRLVHRHNEYSDSLHAPIINQSPDPASNAYAHRSTRTDSTRLDI